MEKDYYKYLDASEVNFRLPIKKYNYEATYDSPFNFTETTSEDILSIDIDSLTSMINKDIKDSGLDNYTFYNFRNFFNELLDCNELYKYTVDSEDLKILYSCVIENIKQINSNDN